MERGMEREKEKRKLDKENLSGFDNERTNVREHEMMMVQIMK